MCERVRWWMLDHGTYRKTERMESNGLDLSDDVASRGCRKITINDV